MTLFDLYKPQVNIDKPIRLIEAFAGYGSQSMALRNIGADFEVHRCYEIDKYAMASYNAVHGTNFEPTDICTVKGVDMGIKDKERFTYLLTYLQFSMHRYKHSRKNGRYGRGFKYPVKPFVADKEDT